MKNYPPFEKWIFEQFFDLDPKKINLTPPYKDKFVKKQYKKWSKLIGGAENVAKKNLIQGKKLA